MSNKDIGKMQVDELIKEFAAAARSRGAAVLDSQTRAANMMFDRMVAIDHQLRDRCPDARENLKLLLSDTNRFVRYYAAVYLLGIVPEQARLIIEENAKYYFDALAGDARGLLRDFDAGRYKPN